MYIKGKANSIMPIYELEKNKQKILMAFEKKSIEEAGTLTSDKEISDKDRKLVTGYMENGFKRIQELDAKMISQMAENVSLFHRISMFFPSTSYLSVNNEISSRGYVNIIKFNRFAKKIKEDFTRFIMDRVYFSNFSKVESFIKADENVFRGMPSLPITVLSGMFITIAWIIVFAAVSFSRYKKSLVQLEEKQDPKHREKDIELTRNKLRMWQTDIDLFGKQLYGLLSGDAKEFHKKGYRFKVTLEGRDLTTGGKPEEFLYLLHPKKLPGDLKVRDLFDLLRRLQKLSRERMAEISAVYGLDAFMNKKLGRLGIIELGNVFLAILDMKAYDLYLFNDVSRAMPVPFAIELRERLINFYDDGALVLFLVSDTLLIKKVVPGSYFREDYTWYDLVFEHKKALEES